MGFEEAGFFLCLGFPKPCPFSGRDADKVVKLELVDNGNGGVIRR